MRGFLLGGLKPLALAPFAPLAGAFAALVALAALRLFSIPQ